jgi:hypothetical protein
MGRKEKSDKDKKKARTISMTDAEWEQLKAIVGDKEISASIIDKFKIKRG